MTRTFVWFWLYLVVYGFAATSILLNALGAYGDHTTLLLIPLVIAVASALGDAVKYFAASKVWSLIERGEYLFAGLAIVVVLCSSIVSLSYALEFFTTNSSKSVQTDKSSAAEVAQLKRELTEVEDALSSLGTTTPIVILKSRLKKLEGRIIRVGSKRKAFSAYINRCPSTHSRLRKACAEHSLLISSLHVSREREGYIKQRKALRAKLQAAGFVSAKRLGTEGSLAKFLGWKLEETSWLVAIFKAITLEIASSVGVALLGVGQKRKLAVRKEERTDVADVEVFATTFLVAVEGARIKASELYGRYKSVCGAHKVEPLGQRAFGMAFPKQTGIKREERGGFRYYLDIQFKGQI